jgi:hypothetical protein
VINQKTFKFILAALAIAQLSACGGGSSTPAPTPTAHTVTVNWTANREAAVNRAGGGYTVIINGQAPIDVPYVSGVAAPTSITKTLMSGDYNVTVSAYSAMNSPGAIGSKSVPSAAFTFSVPY